MWNVLFAILSTFLFVFLFLILPFIWLIFFYRDEEAEARAMKEDRRAMREAEKARIAKLISYGHNMTDREKRKKS